MSERKRQIVVFDLDRTLTRVRTFTPFLIYSFKRRPLRAFTFPIVIFHMLHHKLGSLKRKPLKERILRIVLRGYSREEMDSLARDYAKLLLKYAMRKQGLERIRRYKAENAYLVLATASMDFYARPLGEMLGFDLVVSTKSTWDENNHLLPILASENCYGEAKVSLVRNALNGAISDAAKSEITAYTDHISDHFLLDWSDHAVAINPKANLRAYATKHGFQIEGWD